MQFLLLVASLGAFVSARPDVSHLNNGYNYNRPSNGGSSNVGSSNVPSGSYLPGGNHVQPNFDPRINNNNNGFTSGSGTNGHFSGSGTSSGYVSGSGTSNGYVSGSGTSNGYVSSTGTSNGYVSGSGTSNGYVSGSGTSNGYVSGSSNNGFNSGYNSQPEMIQDQKHVYFFAAPDEEEAPRLRIQLAPSSQKNTKIIFIKAPGQAAPIPEVIAPPSEAEDKTLVYVLVKKQDQLAPITIPAGSSVKQAKPEVYFIKYRSKEEAEQAVHGGLGEQSVGSGVPSVADEQSFIQTLKDQSSQGGSYDNVESLGDIRSGGSSIKSGSSIGSSPGNNYGPPSLSGPY